MNHPRGDLQKLQPDGIDPEILHLLRECQPPEPIEQVVGKRVDLKAVRVHHFALAAHRAEIVPRRRASRLARRTLSCAAHRPPLAADAIRRHSPLDQCMLSYSNYNANSALEFTHFLKAE